MALKDWKKTPVSGRYAVFDNVKTGERLFIEENKTKITPSQKKWNFSYTTFIDGKKSRTFNTKSKALMFVKNYMRTH